LDIGYYAHQSWDTGKKLPWAMLDSGTEPEKLRLELDRAMSQIASTSSKPIQENGHQLPKIT
jgi:hypothetical protein